MKTMDDIMTAAIMPPLLFLGPYSSYEQAEGSSVKLEHIISNAFSALSC